MPLVAKKEPGRLERSRAPGPRDGLACCSGSRGLEGPSTSVCERRRAHDQRVAAAQRLRSCPTEAPLPRPGPQAGTRGGHLVRRPVSSGRRSWAGRGPGQAGGGKAERFRSVEGGADACEWGYRPSGLEVIKRKQPRYAYKSFEKRRRQCPSLGPSPGSTGHAAPPPLPRTTPRAPAPVPPAAPAAQVPRQVPRPALPRSPGLAGPTDCQLPVPGTLSLGPCPVLCHQLSPCTRVLPSCAAQTVVGSTPVARGPRWRPCPGCPSVASAAAAAHEACLRLPALSRPSCGLSLGTGLPGRWCGAAQPVCVLPPGTGWLTPSASALTPGPSRPALPCTCLCVSQCLLPAGPSWVPVASRVECGIGSLGPEGAGSREL